MDPVLERQVFHPPVLRTGVVGNHVHHYLDALGVGGAHQFTVFLVGAVTGIDVVIIAAGVTVIGPVAGVVSQQRSAPEGGGTQVGNVIQVVDNALDITTMAAHGLLPVGFLGRVRGGIDGRVSVGKAVRNNEVDKVGGGITLPLDQSFFPCVNLIGIAHRDAVLLEDESISSRLGGSVYLQVDEYVIGAVGLVDGFDIDAGGTFHGYIGLADILSVDQQLKFGVHPRPPAQRLYVLNDFLCIHG